MDINLNVKGMTLTLSVNDEAVSVVATKDGEVLQELSIPVPSETDDTGAQTTFDGTEETGVQFDEPNGFDDEAGAQQTGDYLSDEEQANVQGQGQGQAQPFVSQPFVSQPPQTAQVQGQPQVPAQSQGQAQPVQAQPQPQLQSQYENVNTKIGDFSIPTFESFVQNRSINEEKVETMKEKVLDLLKKEKVAMTPTEIGLALGKSYNQASSSVTVSLKQLVEDDKVEKTKDGSRIVYKCK